MSMIGFVLYIPLFAATEVLFLVLVAEFAAVMLISTPFICMAIAMFANTDDDRRVDDYMWFFFVQPVEFVCFAQGLIADAFMVWFRRAFRTRKGRYDD